MPSPCQSCNFSRYSYPLRLSERIFQKYHFTTDAESVPGAGAVIGNLERILSAIFLAMNQITAIGFIYTAKSIARFKEIEENKGFAEYYLIGTLFSILYVVIAYFLIFMC